MAKVMTFCFFSLFSDFWSTAILHISSGLKTASWLFKKKKEEKRKKFENNNRKTNHGLGNLDTAPPIVPYNLEHMGQVLSAV